MKLHIKMLLTCLLCIFLVGCESTSDSKQESVPQNEEGANGNTANEDSDTEISRVSFSPHVLSLHYKIVESLPIYNSQPMQVDGDKLYEVLMKDAEIISQQEEVMEINGQDELYKYYESSDGRSWSAYGNTNINFATGKYKSIAVDFGIDYANADPYLKSQQFDFASEEEARTEIETLLKSLDINISKDYESWGIDYKWLQAGNDFDGAVPREWDESLNCYLFRFKIEVDSYPLMPKIAQIRGLERVQTNFVGKTPCIMVVYSDSGIDQMKFLDLLEPESVERTVETINYDQILKNAVNKLSGWELSGKYIIDGIKVEYYPIEEENGTVFLKPMCRVNVTNEDEVLGDNGHVEPYNRFIDLIYDGETGELYLDVIR